MCYIPIKTKEYLYSFTRFYRLCELWTNKSSNYLGKSTLKLLYIIFCANGLNFKHVHIWNTLQGLQAILACLHWVINRSLKRGPLWTSGRPRPERSHRTGEDGWDLWEVGDGTGSEKVPTLGALMRQEGGLGCPVQALVPARSLAGWGISAEL